MKKYIQINGFHPVAWAVIVGTFLSRTGFYMTIPFLGIYLGQVKGIDPATVGAILAVSFFVGTWSSFIGGALSDKFGRYPVMILSMTAWALVFIGFAFAEHTLVFFLLSACNGLFRSVFDPAARALLADVTPAERRTDAFSARYFAINIGGAIGPLAGLKLGAGGQSSMLPFLVSAGIFMVYGIALLFLRLAYPSAVKEKSDPVSVRQSIKIVFRDRVFLYFLLGNIFIAGAYAHLDTTLSQFIGHDRIDTYSLLFFVNAMSVLVLQYPLAKVMKRFSGLAALKAGCLLFGLGLFGFGLFENVYLLGLSMVIFTTGEILCFVVGDVLIGEIAPEPLRGAYYGASGLAFIGQSAGSWIGGFLLGALGFDQGPLIFGMLMLLAFLAFPLFHKGERLREEQDRSQKSLESLAS